MNSAFAVCVATSPEARSRTLVAAPMLSSMTFLSFSRLDRSSSISASRWVSLDWSSKSCFELLSSLSSSSAKFFTLASSSPSLFCSAPMPAWTALVSSPIGATSWESSSSFERM